MKIRCEVRKLSEIWGNCVQNECAGSAVAGQREICVFD
jgi:hypothetical protein